MIRSVAAALLFLGLAALTAIAQQLREPRLRLQARIRQEFGE